SEPALALLGAMPDADLSSHLSPDLDPPSHVFGRFHWDRGKTDLDRRIAKRRGAPLAHWTLHDLRRSFVTNVNELGVAEPHIVEAIVNHISGTKSGVAGRYNHAQYLEQRREALDKWGRYLTGLVGCPLSLHQRNTTEKSDENRGELAS